MDINIVKEVKTSEEWQKQFGCLVYDPDGWDRNNFDYSWFEEKISKQEFLMRFSYSTILDWGTLWEDFGFKRGKTK